MLNPLDWPEATLAIRHILMYDVDVALTAELTIGLDALPPDAWCTIFHERMGHGRPEVFAEALPINGGVILLKVQNATIETVTDAYTEMRHAIAETNARYARRRAQRMALLDQLENLSSTQWKEWLETNPEPSKA